MKSEISREQMNDYELITVLKGKDNNYNKYMEALYTRYEPLVCKVFFSKGLRYYMELGDFKSEAFFKLQQVVEKIDFTKHSYDKENFLLYKYLKNSLLRLVPFLLERKTYKKTKGISLDAENIDYPLVYNEPRYNQVSHKSLKEVISILPENLQILFYQRIKGVPFNKITEETGKKSFWSDMESIRKHVKKYFDINLNLGLSNKEDYEREIEF